ncbi:sensor histidine kinase [Nonomuraea soli]|uniref:Oxygen sensor histidine kinase NreB n=1 Tax=Nonomuraea soli TaxID=1032476 RepID=A0A7W0CPA5_9ACTN|nr:sensor histidine kinase [Nonomuraea soli]MBA2894795.1 signal transduction histidine kinase [Nonomuraea soli]
MGLTPRPSPDRWIVAFHGLYYGCLALGVTIDVLGGLDPLALVTAGVAAAWHYAFVYRRPDLLERVHPMLWHFIVLCSLAVVLMGRDIAYQTVMFGMCPLPYLMLPGKWAYGMAVTMGLSLFAGAGWLQQIGTEPRLLGAAVANLGMLVLVGLFVNYLVRMGEQSRALGVLEERARLAREIHDTLAQGFSGVITQLEAAEQALDALATSDAGGVRRTDTGTGEARRGAHPAIEDPTGQDSDGVAREGAERVTKECAESVARERTGSELRERTERDVRERIMTAKSLARASLAEARRSVHALRPGPLDSDRLDEAVRSEAERWSRRSGVPVTATVNGPPRPLSPDVEMAVLRAVQEGLANVARHARAGRAVVTLSYMGEGVTLDVVDDGRGFDQASRQGVGLAGMRERAASVGGSLTVESAPGEGTALCLSVPRG